MQHTETALPEKVFSCGPAFIVAQKRPSAQAAIGLLLYELPHLHRPVTR